MRFKSRQVNAQGVHPAFMAQVARIDSLWQEIMAFEAIVTSLRDGRHSRGSLHYIGWAADFRTWTAPNSKRQLRGVERLELADSIKDLLGPEYLVLDEHDHFHVQSKFTKAPKLSVLDDLAAELDNVYLAALSGDNERLVA